MRKLANAELGRLSVEEFKAAEKVPVIVVLDNVRSLNNIGSVFRTADSFLLEGVYLCGITAQPPHREIHKTALGATDSVDWQYFKETISAVDYLKGNGYMLLAIEQADESIRLDQFQVSKNEKVALVFGNEVDGVAEDVITRMDACIEIPQHGTKHSLNISVSVGIVVWDIYCKMRAFMQ